MKTDVEMAYDCLLEVAREPGYVGYFTGKDLFAVRDVVGCGIEQVKRAAKLHERLKAIDRADDIHDLKRVMEDLVKDLAR